jgi:ElaB/YqjD/DUF883 family membrane-anchored ribosome-binding protein
VWRRALAAPSELLLRPVIEVHPQDNSDLQEDRNMNATAGATNGGSGTADTTQVKEHLRAATDAAANAARNRAQQAQQWARSQWSGLQERVEAQPYQAAAWALGIGFVAGVLLTSLMRGRR